MYKPFQLSRTIAVHSNDVRAVALLNNNSVVTASRDGKAILTTSDGLSTTLVDGQVFLNSVIANEEGSIVFIGSHDSSIVCHDLATGQQSFYIGHSANVSCLDYLEKGSLLASGSWDHTVRVWQSAESSVELKGHEQNVWDVKFLSANLLLSASADKTIKLWDIQSRKPLKTFKGHEDVVRALVVISESQFVSASNDGTLRIWNIETGAQEAVLTGHTSFIYSLTRIGNTTQIVSASEDRTVRIWDIAKPPYSSLQTIVLPSISQWSVASNASGDFAVGSSDNTCRVFTQSAERTADPETLAAFQQSVKDSAMGENEIDESQVADASVLNAPGKHEGQVVIVRNGSALEAHQFSGGFWAKIGDVVGQNQSSGSKRATHEGKQYDYVFDVDIQDGVPPLKLPFNNSDNPYLVAEKFVVDNQLPPSYVEQVVQFLIQNSQAKSFDATAAPPQQQPTQPTPTQQQQPRTSGETPEILRYSQPLFLKAFQAPALLKALQKTADERGDNLAPYALDSLLGTLPSSAPELLRAALELKGKWIDNVDQLLPIFDLMRIAIADAVTLPYQAVWVNLLDALVPDLPKHLMLATRGVANLVARPDFDANNSVNKAMLSQAVAMLQTAVSASDSVSKPLAVALATLVLNLAIVHPAEIDFVNLIKVIAPKITSTGDAEAVYRLALAIGIRSTASATEARSFKASWFANAPSEERIATLLEVVKPRISS